MPNSPFVKMDVIGDKQLEQTLESLGAAVAERVLEAAMRKAAVPTAQRMRELAPVGEFGPKIKGKHLRDTIVIRAATNKSQRRKHAARGTLRFAQIFVGSTAPYAHLVEFGHLLVRYGARATTRAGRVADALALKVTGRSGTRRVVGHVAARPFIRPAWDATRLEALGIFKVELRKALVRAVHRAARRAAAGPPIIRDRAAQTFDSEFGTATGPAEAFSGALTGVE